MNILCFNGGFRGLIAVMKGEDHETVVHDIMPIICNNLKIDKWANIHSTKMKSRKHMKNFVNEYNDPTNNFIGVFKSMGCVEAEDFFKNVKKGHWLYKNTLLFFIDGHSKLMKNMFKKAYGKNKPIDRPGWMYRSNIKILNFFQHDKWPHGAQFVGADEEYQLRGVTHFTIIHHPKILGHVQEECIKFKNIIGG